MISDGGHKWDSSQHVRDNVAACLSSCFIVDTAGVCFQFSPSTTPYSNIYGGTCQALKQHVASRHLWQAEQCIFPLMSRMSVMTTHSPYAIC